MFGIVSLVGMSFEDFGNENEKLRNITKEKDVARKFFLNGTSKYIVNGREKVGLKRGFFKKTVAVRRRNILPQGTLRRIQNVFP